MIRRSFQRPIRGRIDLAQNGLYWTRRHGPQNSLALGIVGIRVVGECLLAVHFEDIRSEGNTLRVSLATIEVHNNSHLQAPSGSRRKAANATALRAVDPRGAVHGLDIPGTRTTVRRTQPDRCGFVGFLIWPALPGRPGILL
jgi:hypothetical protein